MERLKDRVAKIKKEDYAPLDYNSGPEKKRTNMRGICEFEWR